jgi:hypothetical protein
MPARLAEQVGHRRCRGEVAGQDGVDLVLDPGPLSHQMRPTGHLPAQAAGPFVRQPHRRQEIGGQQLSQDPRVNLVSLELRLRSRRRAGMRSRCAAAGSVAVDVGESPDGNAASRPSCASRAAATRPFTAARKGSASVRTIQSGLTSANRTTRSRSTTTTLGYGNTTARCPGGRRRPGCRSRHEAVVDLDEAHRGQRVTGLDDAGVVGLVGERAAEGGVFAEALRGPLGVAAGLQLVEETLHGRCHGVPPRSGRNRTGAFISYMRDR